jgi:uncharacterized RDD family membrane protein YckC
MEQHDVWAVTVPRTAPTVPPPRLPPPPACPPGAAVLLAEPWRRVVAWLTDVLPFVAAALLAIDLLGGAAAFHAVTHAMWTKNVDGKALGLPSLTATSPVPMSAMLRLAEVALTGLVLVGVWAAYRILLVARTGQTLGRRLLGIAVVDAAHPSRNPSIPQLVKRFLVPQGTGLVPLPCTGMAGYLWVFKDARRQGLHDKAAKTLVVRRPR